MCNCSFCQDMDSEERKRYYPRTLRWFCPTTNHIYQVEWGETTSAKQKLRDNILDKMANGTFGEKVQESFIEGTMNMIHNPTKQGE